ncbi:LPXTG cell wall anchor domain-containing protein [Leucobacter komagatae]|uniref:LPXTG cell wall anchor domain-containing protein n=1 Tax=Leucobacter komagatae TaxID=55969 RepID=UPI003B20CBDC
MQSATVQEPDVQQHPIAAALATTGGSVLAAGTIAGIMLLFAAGVLAVRKRRREDAGAEMM